MYELTLRVPQDQVEAVSDRLLDELDALSVSVEDADADTEAEQALFGEPGLPAPAPGWARSTLYALFETEAQAEQAAAELFDPPDDDLDPDADPQGPTVTPVPEEDWVRLTQSQFTPVAITEDFWVVPSWHEVPAAARSVIRLDPGLAFGTGTHPTTRMCLRWLARHPERYAGRRVLDYGCGSGILGIGALRLGAGSVDAVDIDPAAVQATTANASDNAVTLHSGAPDSAQGSYDLVLANILATPLKLLAPLLIGHLAPGGWLLLAGLLTRQTAELQAAYAPTLALAIEDEEDGWVLLVAHKSMPIAAEGGAGTPT